MKHIFTNWKTTAAGLVAIITGILHYHSNPGEAITSISAGIGLIAAKDGGANNEAGL